MAKWIIDPEHSDVHFKTRYLLISSVTGEFRKFAGTVETANDDFTDARITFSADTASVDTNNEKRDAHLREVDFFDVAKHPRLEFVSDSFVPEGERDYLLKGTLTIKGVSHKIDLKVTPGGKAMNAEGKPTVGFEVSGHVNRYEYGLVWALLTESGGIVLAEDVKIHANVVLVKG